MPLRTMRRRPGRSVTSMSPFGRKARLQGFSRPFTTGTARSLTPTVSTSRGASGNGSVGTRGNPPGAFDAPGGPPRPTGGCSGRAGAGCCAVAGAWSERAIARVMAVAVEAVAVCVCLCIDLSPEPMNLARRVRVCSRQVRLRKSPKTRPNLATSCSAGSLDPGDSGSEPLSLSSVIFACSAAAIRISTSGGFGKPLRGAAAASRPPIFPVAQTMKM